MATIGLDKIITSVIQAVVGAIPQLIDAGVKLFVALVQNLPTIITSIVAAIPRIITSVVQAVIGAIPQIINAGVQLFIALVQNLPTLTLWQESGNSVQRSRFMYLTAPAQTPQFQHLPTALPQGYRMPTIIISKSSRPLTALQ